MARSKKETLTDAERAKRDRSKLLAARRAKAARIRKDVRDGKPVTAEHLAYLAEYDAEPHGNAKAIPTVADFDAAAGAAAEAPADGGIPAADVDAAAPPPADATPADGVGDAPPIPPPMPRGVPLAPPPPPRAVPRASSAAGDDWITEFGGGPGPARRAMCIEAADLWRGGLRRLAKYIEEGGGTPLVDVESKELYNRLVLASHAVIPRDLTITPELEAAGFTTGLLVQAAIRTRERKRRMAEAATSAARYSAPTPAPAAPVREPDRAAAEPMPGLKTEPPPPPPPPSNGVPHAPSPDPVLRNGPFAGAGPIT